MHGRVKVKTTEEQQAAILAEKREKAKLFTKARNAIMHSRKERNGVGNEKVLMMTAGLLEKHPDFLTIFNYRREVLAQFESLKPEAFDSMIEADLILATTCLLRNPKSYSAWNHRRWCILSFKGDAPLEKELELTKEYLRKDNRNFHCWDYRRFVVRELQKRGDITVEDELEFSQVKIVENYSNYSAWHYRSKLLMQKYDVKYGLDLPDDVLDEEIEFAINPIFINPADQSSWIYLQWVLSKAPPLPQIIRGMLHCNTVIMVLSQPSKVTTAMFSCSGFCENEKESEDSSKKMRKDECLVGIESTEALDDDGCVWLLNLSFDPKSVSIQLSELAKSDWFHLPEPIQLLEDQPYVVDLSHFVGEERLPEKVQNVVDSIEELLEEEDSGDEGTVGCLTTLAYLYTTHIPMASITTTKCTEWYFKLQKFDHFRRGYYKEMLRRLLVVDAALQLQQGETVLDISFITVDDALSNHDENPDAGDNGGDAQELDPFQSASLVEGVEFAPWVTHLKLSSFDLSSQDLHRLRALPLLDSIEVGESIVKAQDL
eukprot:m.17346 g.17346  ORF g.17346 m.17346 type:complete len:544 (-) comp4774_c0_seq1:409-2040(-)